MSRLVIQSRLLPGVLSLAAALAFGCGDDDGGSGPGIDAGPDSSIDGGPDAGPNPSTDGGPDAQVPPDGSVPAAGDLWVYTANKKLHQFSSTTGTVVKTIDAPAPGTEEVVGADIRPALAAADAKIYAVTNAGKLYSVDPTSGAFTNVPLIPNVVSNVTDPFTAISGEARAVDFNPFADRLRIITSTGQSLRVNVVTGAVITDTAVASTDVAGGAYSNNWPRPVPPPPAPCATSLYVINAVSGKLQLVNPPNAGTLVDVATLTGVVTPTAIGAFDIVTTPTGQNLALISATEAAGEVVYQLDLSTAKATPLATVPGQGKIIALLGSPLTTTLADKPGELVATTLSSSTPPLPSKVVTFNRLTPGTLCTEVAITGLDQPTSEEVVGGDVRPKDKTFYVLTRGSDSVGRLRSLNVTTGVLGPAKVLTAAAGDDLPYESLPLGDYGVDFNPTVDRLRVVSGAGANLRIDPTSTDAIASVTTDANITSTPTGAVITEVAYTNPGGASEPAPTVVTTLYAVDANANALGRIGDDPAGTSPNLGVFQVPVPLDQQIFRTSGGDIEAVTNTALLGLSVGDTDIQASTNTTLFRADFTGTPVLTSYGKIGTTGEPITSLSFLPKP